MGNSIWLILTGSAISLVSTISVIILKHWLDTRIMATRVKEYPLKTLYDKQTEFFDKVAPILGEINGFLSEIDVWIVEKSPDAKKRTQKTAQSNQPLGKLHELMESYFVYLPRNILESGQELFSKGIALQYKFSSKSIWECFDLLFRFQNLIRHFAGTDNLSLDLIKSFGQRNPYSEESSQVI
jgi:hypothetical protein